MKKAFTNIFGKGYLSKLFLLSVVFAYLVVLFINHSLFLEALSFSLKLLLRLVPVLFLVFIFLFIVDFFVSAEMVIKFLGEGSGLKGWLIALIGGIISTGPIYMWYPLLKSLKDRGMSDSLIAVFLYNRAVKIPMIPIMIYYFGLNLVVALTFWMLCASILVGLIVGKITKL